MGSDPAGGFEHLQSPADEVRRWRRLGQRCQRGAQHLGLPAKTANPKLPTLIGHGSFRGGGCQCLCEEQAGKQKLVEEKLRVIADMNHHIRNALQG